MLVKVVLVVVSDTRDFIQNKFITKTMSYLINDTRISRPVNQQNEYLGTYLFLSVTPHIKN